MIRCVRLWSGPDGKSHFEEGVTDLEPGSRGDTLSSKCRISVVSFQKTDTDPKLGWHPDPARQLVVTLSGTLEFTTHDGHFSLRPGDILFTEDTVAGHNWALLGGQPWRRLYAILDKAAVVPFRPTKPPQRLPIQRHAKKKQSHDRSSHMIRCVRIWTGEDRNSHFEEGVIDLEPGQRGDELSRRMATTTISFEETASGGAFAWHDAPIRQLVITLSGTLDFQTREGEHFMIRPGDILLAEDTAGSGHSWRLTDNHPWRRAYVVLQPGTAVPFRVSKPQHVAA